jgi:hypothetical protein
MGPLTAKSWHLKYIQESMRRDFVVTPFDSVLDSVVLHSDITLHRNDVSVLKKTGVHSSCGQGCG